MDGSATEARPAYGDVDPAVPGGDREGDRGENGNGAGAAAPWPTVLSGKWLLAAEIGVVAVVAIGLVLRFWTRSALWLDEALTVDIARLPLHEIPSYLKRDGAPPLYYVLLHFWMKPFGDSDIAVRSLSGIFSVATLPVVWIVGRRIGGRSVAWVLLVVVASAPFAVYYATEARMYSLVMFLTACGLWALSRVLEQARPGNLVALAVVTAALLYSQYWALYLVGSLGLWLLWQLWRGRPEWRSNARWAFGAVVVGCLAFAPWVPTFLYQSRYTGTPWAATPTYAAIINAITGFTDNQASNAVTGSNQGRLLALGYFALAGLGLFGAARGRWHIDLDIRTRPQGRGLAFAVVVTLAAAITGGILSQSAFSARYAAVVFIPLLALLALGTMTFADARFRSRRRGGRRPRRGGGEHPERHDPADPGPRRRRHAGRARPAGRHRRLLPRPARPSRLPADRGRRATTRPRSRGARRRRTSTGSTTRTWPRLPIRRRSPSSSRRWPATTTTSGSSPPRSTRASTTSARSSPPTCSRPRGTAATSGSTATRRSTTSRWA